MTAALEVFSGDHGERVGCLGQCRLHGEGAFPAPAIVSAPPLTTPTGGVAAQLDTRVHSVTQRTSLVYSCADPRPTFTLHLALLIICLQLWVLSLWVLCPLQPSAL